MIQGINSHNIDLVLPEYFSFRSRKFKEALHDHRGVKNSRQTNKPPQPSEERPDKYTHSTYEGQINAF